MNGAEVRLQAAHNAGKPVRVIWLRLRGGRGQALGPAGRRSVPGSYRCGYARAEDGRYEWWRDGERGVGDRGRGVGEMTGLIGNPDYWDWIG